MYYSAARLIMKLPKHSHISQILVDLHWLPIKYRISEVRSPKIIIRTLQDLCVYIARDAPRGLINICYLSCQPHNRSEMSSSAS